MTQAAPAVLEIKGEEVSAVAFVRDYVEFHFDGLVLRVFTDPQVTLAGGTVVRFPEPGSRDVLCALIDATVQAVRFDEDNAIEIELGPHGLLRVSLAPANVAEAATFQRQPVNSPLEVY